MIGAMYENGGNTLQRYLDGHPELMVYPFESQLGTRYVQDMFSSTFPLKYRWPVFPTATTLNEDYGLIIDEECKIRIKTPLVSKFRNFSMELDDNERKESFLRHMEGRQKSVSNLVECFFRSTFDSWMDFRGSGQEKTYVGYSPIIVIDAEKILKTYTNALMVHVVRNPYSAYAETKRRPVPLDLHQYISGWVINQYFALFYKRKYPDRLLIVRYEDLIADSKVALAPLCRALGIDGDSKSLNTPSWNGYQMSEVYPWGTIRIPTLEENLKRATELKEEEKQEISQRTEDFLRIFDFRIEQ